MTAPEKCVVLQSMSPLSFKLKTNKKKPLCIPRGAYNCLGRLEAVHFNFVKSDCVSLIW